MIAYFSFSFASSKRPLDGGVLLVDALVPGTRLGGELCDISESAIAQALSAEKANLDLRLINQRPCLRVVNGKGRIISRRPCFRNDSPPPAAVGGEIVQHQVDRVGAG